MRLQVDLDKLEDLTNAFTKRSANKRLPGFKWLGWASFPPEQTLVTDTVTMKAVLRHSVSFLIFITLYLAAWIFVFVTLTAYFFLSANLHHHIHHLHWRLIKLLYSFSSRKFFQHDPPLEFVCMILGMTGLNIGFFSALRWAWNRRADRLNREAISMPPAAAVSPDVWPPPPLGPTDAEVRQ